MGHIDEHLALPKAEIRTNRLNAVAKPRLNWSAMLAVAIALSIFAVDADATEFNKQLPSKAPEESAREAFAAGDFGYLGAPTCLDFVTLDRAPKKARPLPGRILARCTDFANEWNASQMGRLESYARRYNNTMYDLRNPGRRK